MTAGLADESLSERCNWRIGGKSVACEEVLSDQAPMAAAQAFDTDYGSDSGACLTRWTCGHCKPETQRLRGMPLIWLCRFAFASAAWNPKLDLASTAAPPLL
jgi:hypothetical protein